MGAIWVASPNRHGQSYHWVIGNFIYPSDFRLTTCDETLTTKWNWGRRVFGEMGQTFHFTPWRPNPLAEQATKNIARAVTPQVCNHGEESR